MKFAALPFNASPQSEAPLGRQLANFVCENLRMLTEVEAGMINLFVEIEQEGGRRIAMASLGENLPEDEIVRQVMGQGEVEVLMDGLLSGSEEDGFELQARFHRKDGDTETMLFSKAELSGPGLFQALEALLRKAAELVGEETEETDLEIGTEDPRAFRDFLRGYDAVQYVQQTQGRIVREYSLEEAIERLLASVRADADFLAPYEMLVQLVRMLVQHRMGPVPKMEEALQELTRLAEDDARAWFALGELYEATGRFDQAEQAFEKAIAIEPDEPAHHTRLGIVFLQQGMPANAEPRFRKAMDLEDEPKPSLDFLSQALFLLGRGHEVPPLWEERVDRDPQNALLRAKLAMARLQAGDRAGALRTLEDALAEADEPAVIKRHYAPLLMEDGAVDRALDFYEDCLDENPTDVQLLIEYARALDSADREADLPGVLRNILTATQDPNLRAPAQARLLELEQTNRTDQVEKARQLMDQGRFEEAVRLLKPLSNWLADYWKLWALLSAAHNRLGQHPEAEEAAKRLLALYPACEPAYGELATALAAQGRNEEAYQALGYARQLMPQSLPLAINFALAAHRIGRVEEARQLARSIREATKGDPQIAEILRPIDG
ncbi:MAG: tetratricopeptide repeat protein [Fimbriimonadales bacterium]|nr:tetratricopeptide repeat protein [Fimbriimonadales bacterium]